MAPPLAPGRDRTSRENEDGWETRGDRKARKPLVEKKRRARINESLQELRLLLAGAEVRRAGGLAGQSPLTRRGAALSLPFLGAEREQLQAEASERFAAGYIQCMHEVHTFVSTCQAIDATVAAELLNHLLESMPLREGSSFRDLLGDALAGPPGAPGRSGWPTGGVLGSPLPSPPAPGDDLCSDLEEAPEAELTRAPAEGPDLVPAALGSLTAARIAQSVWRPW
uniref:Hes family bHLH transcription factor 6 n=1 Tax=Ursus americanus TaxID=9643 RepID=A0A452RB61_URSAM